MSLPFFVRSLDRTIHWEDEWTMVFLRWLFLNLFKTFNWTASVQRSILCVMLENNIQFTFHGENRIFGQIERKNNVRSKWWRLLMLATVVVRLRQSSTASACNARASSCFLRTALTQHFAHARTAYILTAKIKPY